MTPSTTNRAWRFKKWYGLVLGLGSNGPRVAEYTMTTPMTDDQHGGDDQDVVERGHVAARGNVCSGECGHNGGFGDRIPAVTAPSLAPLPALVGTLRQPRAARIRSTRAEAGSTTC